MNTQEVVSRSRKTRTLMALTVAIIALVLSACGQNTVAEQATAQPANEETLPVPVGPEGSYSISPTPGSVTSFWSEMADTSWGPNTTYMGTGEVSPIYRPSQTAGDIDALGRQGDKCIVSYAKTRGLEKNRFGVIIYLEYRDMMWGFGKDNVDSEASDSFVTNYDAYCFR